MPSGSVASSPPHSSFRSIWSRTSSNCRSAEARDQSAAGRETAVSVHQMLAARAHAGASYELSSALSRRMRKFALDGRAGFEEALVGQIGVAVLDDRPSASATSRGSRGHAGRASPLGEAGIVHVQGHDPGVEPGGVEAVEQVVGSAAADRVAAPDHLALPEGRAGPRRRRSSAAATTRSTSGESPQRRAPRSRR